MMAGALAETATADEKEEHGKLAKRLERFTSPAEVAKAVRAGDIRLASIKPPLPDKPTPEQLTEWRKSNGIPETPDKYDYGLKEGVVPGDHDKKVLDAWVSKVHSAHASPEVVKVGVAAYMEIRDEIAQELADRDEELKESTMQTLMTEWGTDYKSNVSGVKSMLAQAPSAVSEAILNARGPDGTPIMSNAETAKWFVQQARTLGFVGATVVPQGGDVGKSIDDELAAIEKTQYLPNGERNPAYWKNEKAQARMRELITARDRMKK